MGGNICTSQVANPVVGRIPVVWEVFQYWTEPMSGGSTTVKQTTQRLGPSERMNASVGDWDASLLNLPIGESGQRGFAPPLAMNGTRTITAKASPCSSTSST